MSAKARFLKKLQDQQPRSRGFDNKSQADIAEFRDRLGELHETVDGWLTDTGIQVEDFSVSVLDSFAGGSSFVVPGMALRYEQRVMRFTPVFLYGQGVTGGVEIALCAAGQTRVLYRLFMRSSEEASWSFSHSGSVTAHRESFNEEAFFEMIGPLLPE
jgi:hypothetical protein